MDGIYIHGMETLYILKMIGAKSVCRCLSIMEISVSIAG